jgi:long-chain acyl-CoA synthetase
MAIRDFTLNTVIERNARLYAGRTAFVFEELTVTHAEYLARVRRLAAGLRAAGLGPGDRVAVIAQNRPEFLELYGDAARLGAIVVPVNWRSPPTSAHVITDTAPALLLADPAYQAACAALRARCPSLKTCVGFDSTEPGFMTYTICCARGPTAAAAARRQRGGHHAHGRCWRIAAQRLLAQRSDGGRSLIAHWRLGRAMEPGMLPMFTCPDWAFMAVCWKAGGAWCCRRFDLPQSSRPGRTAHVRRIRADAGPDPRPGRVPRRGSGQSERRQRPGHARDPGALSCPLSRG